MLLPNFVWILTKDVCMRFNQILKEKGRQAYVLYTIVKKYIKWTSSKNTGSLIRFFPFILML